VHAFIEDAGVFPGIAALEEELHALDIQAHIVSLSRNELLAMPVRASKGFALRFFATQWGLAFDRLLVAGGVATDEDMLRGNPLGAVVTANGKRELPGLTDLDRVIFTRHQGSGGILEAIEHYDFFGACGVPEQRDAAEGQS
ncbi:MAG TPA: HAD family hydrolase, partial [Halothiobacillaceae bacterium]|nr:HAD family hydrolase [Halothiobacillaceae bacterium]